VAGWTVELGSLLLVFLIALWLLRKRQDIAAPITVGFVYFFLNREIYEAMFFPLHTSTFALLPVMTLGAWILARDWKLPFTNKEILFFAFMGFLLSCYKQNITAMPLGLALALLFSKEHRKPAFFLTVFLAVVALATMKWRAFLIGPIAGHLGRVHFSLSDVIALYGWDFAQAFSLFKALIEVLPYIVLAFPFRKSKPGSGR
jgi:hypothetical protein